MASVPFSCGVMPRHGLAMVASEGRSPQDLSCVSSNGGSIALHRVQMPPQAHKPILHQMQTDDGNMPTQYIVTINGERTAVHHGGIIEEAVYQSSGYGNDPHSKQVFTTLSDDHMQHYVEYGDPSAHYFTTNGIPLTSNGQMSLEGQVVTTGGQAPDIYFMHDAAAVANGAGHMTSATPRASPATVQWLLENYETAEGVSLPRSTLYNHYLRHCSESKLEPMNPASFGKLIRSVFLGLRTRRLGTRGCSKYHYYGIALKATSNYNGELMEADSSPTVAHQSATTQRYQQSSVVSNGSNGNRPSTDNLATSQLHLQYLGDAYGAIPNFGHIDVSGELLPDGITLDHLHTYEQLYVQHCEEILHVVVNLQFSLIDSLWKSFWNTSLAHKQGEGGLELAQHLPMHVLRTLCCMPAVMKFTSSSDFAFYQALIEVLIPDVLRPIPSSLTQVIRNFAKGLENSLRSSMTGVPEPMIKAKSITVCTFAQTLRRYTSLNHLAQAARAVLQNSSQIQQMLLDLNRIDFGNIQEQASWVCHCDDTIIQQLEVDLKSTLEQQNCLEHWAKWLESVLDRILVPDDTGLNFTRQAQQFLLKWSFYCSMIIRDLTLRSAASFGSFHLIRLLFDEYMFYLVEHKIAVVTGCMPIEAMANCQLVAADDVQPEERSAPKRNADGVPVQQSMPASVAYHPDLVLKMEAQHSPSVMSTASNGSLAASSSISMATPTISFQRAIGAPMKLSLPATSRPLTIGGIVAKSANGGETKTVLLQHPNGTARTLVMVPVTAVKSTGEENNGALRLTPEKRVA